VNLFVYGTLMSGHGNNCLLEGAKFLGVAYSHKAYVLANGGFPVAYTKGIEDFPLLPIRGEVWEVEDHHIARCDRLEGHPNWYKRGTITASVVDHGDVETFIYEMNEEPNRLSVCQTTMYDNKMYYYW